MKVFYIIQGVSGVPLHDPLSAPHRYTSTQSRVGIRLCVCWRWCSSGILKWQLRTGRHLCQVLRLHQTHQGREQRRYRYTHPADLGGLLGFVCVCVFTVWLSRSVYSNFDCSVVHGHLGRTVEHGYGQSKVFTYREKYVKTHKLTLYTQSERERLHYQKYGDCCSKNISFQNHGH